LSSAEYLNNSRVNLYPIPAQNELFVKMEDNTLATSILIRSIDGKILTTKQITADNNGILTIQLDGIPTGNYILEVYHNHGKTSKIITRN
jgi:hypothetical protein